MTCSSCLHPESDHAPDGCRATLTVPADGLIPAHTRICGCRYVSRPGSERCDICGAFLTIEHLPGDVPGFTRIRTGHSRADCADRVRETFAHLNQALHQAAAERDLERRARRQMEEDHRRRHEINLAGDMSPRWALWLVEQLLSHSRWRLEVLYGPRSVLTLSLPLDGDPPPTTLPPLDELSERAMLACVQVNRPKEPQ